MEVEKPDGRLSPQTASIVQTVYCVSSNLLFCYWHKVTVFSCTAIAANHVSNSRWVARACYFGTMSGEKGWSQALLIGGGIVAAGGILYYLYSSSSVGSSAMVQIYYFLTTL